MGEWWEFLESIKIDWLLGSNFLSLKIKIALSLKKSVYIDIFMNIEGINNNKLHLIHRSPS